MGSATCVRHPLEIHIFREKLKKTLNKLKDYEGPRYMQANTFLRR